MGQSLDLDEELSESTQIPRLERSSNIVASNEQMYQENPLQGQTGANYERTFVQSLSLEQRQQYSNIVRAYRHQLLRALQANANPSSGQQMLDEATAQRLRSYVTAQQTNANRQSAQQPMQVSPVGVQLSSGLWQAYANSGTMQQQLPQPPGAQQEHSHNSRQRQVSHPQSHDLASALGQVSLHSRLDNSRQRQNVHLQSRGDPSPTSRIVMVGHNPDATDSNPNNDVNDNEVSESDR